MMRWTSDKVTMCKVANGYILFGGNIDQSKWLYSLGIIVAEINELMN